MFQKQVGVKKLQVCSEALSPCCYAQPSLRLYGRRSLRSRCRPKKVRERPRHSVSHSPDVICAYSTICLCSWWGANEFQRPRRIGRSLWRIDCFDVPRDQFLGKCEFHPSVTSVAAQIRASELLARSGRRKGGHTVG